MRFYLFSTSNSQENNDEENFRGLYEYLDIFAGEIQDLSVFFGVGGGGEVGQRRDDPRLDAD